jgi:hypothetical protein
MEQRSNDSDRGNRRTKKTCPCPSLSTNLGLRGEKPVTNCPRPREDLQRNKRVQSSRQKQLEFPPSWPSDLYEKTGLSGFNF